jgi:hypothetical protein
MRGSSQIALGVATSAVQRTKGLALLALWPLTTNVRRTANKPGLEVRGRRWCV